MSPKDLHLVKSYKNIWKIMMDKLLVGTDIRKLENTSHAFPSIL